MKKMFVIAVMALAICNASMAQKLSKKNSINDDTSYIDYSFKVNNRAVDSYLKLDENQAIMMEYIIERFDYDLRKVGRSKEEKRLSILGKAITYNLSAAHKVLDEKQYHKYLIVFNNTLKTKNIDKLYLSEGLAINK
ncbi:MAG: hypothetical protein Q4B58_08675 [Bacteroidales bacterium]|nr:hypothetical protein [Bacteroidales bacterium]